MVLALKSGPQIAAKVGNPAGLLCRRIWYSVVKSGVLGITEYRQGRPLVLDIVLSSQKEFVDNVEIQEPLGSSDHNQLHFNINIKSDKTKVKQCGRDFRKGNYREIRKNLAHIYWDEKMKNKTATECWDILRGELDTAIDSYVPMKKQGKRSKKKHLSKEAFRKMRYKKNMWRVYKHTGKDKDYEVYKEALNAATNEVRKA